MSCLMVDADSSPNVADISLLHGLAVGWGWRSHTSSRTVLHCITARQLVLLHPACERPLARMRSQRCGKHVRCHVCDVAFQTQRTRGCTCARIDALQMQMNTRMHMRTHGKSITEAQSSHRFRILKRTHLKVYAVLDHGFCAWGTTHLHSWGSTLLGVYTVLDNGFWAWGTTHLHSCTLKVFTPGGLHSLGQRIWGLENNSPALLGVYTPEGLHCHGQRTWGLGNHSPELLGVYIVLDKGFGFWGTTHLHSWGPTLLGFYTVLDNEFWAWGTTHMHSWGSTLVGVYTVLDNGFGVWEITHLHSVGSTLLGVYTPGGLHCLGQRIWGLGNHSTTDFGFGDPLTCP